MITITPEAARQLREMASNGAPAVLRFDADPDGDGGFDCSVGLVESAPDGATIEEVEGVTLAFCGSAESIFAGSIVGLNADGELTLEMVEGDCEHCNHEEGDDCSCGGGCCG